MEREIFRDIKGFDGKYQIGNKGTVKSLVFKKEKILSPFNNGKGYHVVTLWKCGKRKNYYVHRLVAETFLTKETGKNVVNHKDHNTYNNYEKNLEWCTQRENVLYSVDKMKHEKSKCKPTNTGEKYIRKYKNSYRIQIKKLGICKQFKTIEEAKEYKRLVMI